MNKWIYRLIKFILIPLIVNLMKANMVNATKEQIVVFLINFKFYINVRNFEIRQILS